MNRSWVSRAAFGLVLSGAVAGCGGDSGDPLDPSTFAGKNADKIRFDCQQTIQCASHRGEMLADDPINTCVEDTARLLEANPELHTLYVSNVTRCQNLAHCEYTECALLDTQGGYGQTQMGNVTYNCQQDVACRQQLGMLVSDAQIELNSCIATNVGWLDTFTAEQRTMWESSFAACSALAGCDFANCFPF